MDRDAAALRLFVDEGHTVLLAQVSKYLYVMPILTIIPSELRQEHGPLRREGWSLHCAVQGQGGGRQGGVSDQDHCQVGVI